MAARSEDVPRENTGAEESEGRMSRTRHHGYQGKRRAFGDNWRWLRNWPKWWDKLMHHAPARRQERDMLRKLEEEGYPDRRKPHNYYW